MRTMVAALALVCAAAILARSASAGEASGGEGVLENRWVYISHNFVFKKNVDEVVKVIERAGKAGYNGVLLTDCKFFRWNEMKGTEYEDNVRIVRKAIKDAGMKCIVVVCGEGTDLLSNDPNLAEGTPVVDAPFVVKDGKLVPADEDLKAQNLSLDQASKENQPDGWYVDDPGKVSFVDTEVKCEGRASLRFQDVKNSSCGNGRANQKVAVKPFRYYHLSVKVKTQDFAAPGTVNIMAYTPKQCLNHQHFDIAPTQDWKTYDIVFNTLDNTELSLYFGSWGGTTGKIWFDDLKLEPGGFVNLIRREAAPLKLTSEDGKTIYEEGKDVAPVKDPKMGNVKWPGLYDYWYEPPTITVPAGSKLKERQKVLASYYHTMICYGYGVVACMCEPKVMELNKWQVENVKRVLEPDGYMLTHDEIRHHGWDESCKKSGLTPAQMLAKDLKECTALIKKADPGKPIYDWSDMLEPYHNASKSGQTYYLVKGIDPWHNSWEGMDKDLIIVKWHGFPEKRAEALKFFADRGHKQILAGYYDAPVENILPWLKEAAAVNGISGVMYTTWGNDFSQLENFLKVVKEFQGK